MKKSRKKNSAKRHTKRNSGFPTGKWVKVDKVKVNRRGTVVGVVMRDKEMKRVGLKKKAK
jgi:hypothetical protein